MIWTVQFATIMILTCVFLWFYWKITDDNDD